VWEFSDGVAFFRVRYRIGFSRLTFLVTVNVGVWIVLELGAKGVVFFTWSRSSVTSGLCWR